MDKKKSQKIPCPCTKCRGRLAHPKTVRSHEEKQRELEEAQSLVPNTTLENICAWYNVHHTHHNKLETKDSKNMNNATDVEEPEVDASHIKRRRLDGRRMLDVENEEMEWDIDERNLDRAENRDEHFESYLDNPYIGDTPGPLNAFPMAIDAAVLPDGDGNGSDLEYVDDPLIQGQVRALGDPPIHIPNVEFDESESDIGSKGRNSSSEDSDELRRQLDDSEEEFEEGIHLDNRPMDVESEEELDPEARIVIEAEKQYSNIEHVAMVQELVDRIRMATLDEARLPEHVLTALRNPEQNLIDMNNKNLRFSINLYLSCVNTSEATYKAVRASVLDRYPESDILSYKSVKKHITLVTGVVSVEDDMCVNGCHAFVAQFEDLEACHDCHEPRYFAETRGQKRTARKKATTVLLGPQLQAIRQSLQGAQAIRYRERKVQEIYDHLEEIAAAGTAKDSVVYDDIFSGSQFLELYERIEITEDDTTVMFSLDGAQLYRDKKSDTWIAIWIITDYDPKTRYRSKHVLPALIIPGPQKPKKLESYLFRSFHHLSALQQENEGRGLKMWDAVLGRVIELRIIFLLGTADAVALPELDGRVGHHGAQGCRLGCPMKGRHKPRSGFYFSPHLRPNNYTVIDCDHPDFDFRQVTQLQVNPEVYERNIQRLVRANTQAEYEEIRKVTGLCKPTLLSGLRPDLMLPVPMCFTVDLMHLMCLNIGQLFLPLWRGTLKVEATDRKASWKWVTFTGKAWTDHGQLVEEATTYFPSSFHRPPRNPVLKINSGYKATEWYLYLFGLGPGLFRTILGKLYYRNFCKLVRGVCIVMQRRMTGAQVQEAQKYLSQHVEEFENLYTQRRVDRMHLNRPLHHTVIHTPSEIPRVGTGAHSTQFTLERIIGELVKMIRQPSNPFANCAVQMVKHAEINAFKSMYPVFDKDSEIQLPWNSREMGNGYILLQPRDKAAHAFVGLEREAIQQVCQKHKLQRWSRIRLPNGQVARSKLVEDKRISPNKRITRNIMFEGDFRYAEVLYFFVDEDFDNADIPPKTYALISLYSVPNVELLEESYSTLQACRYGGDGSLYAIEVSSIVSVISMQPLPTLPNDPPDYNDLWFAVEKSGIEDADLTGMADILEDVQNP